jgi:ABC-type transporter Mla subunit MlaD
MNRRGISRTAWLGLAALASANVIVLGVYFGAKYLRGGGGYTFGVHFPTAAGVGPGAQVFLNGVVIGSVTKIVILPDTSVDFIVNVSHATDIPRNATYTVQSTLTGSPTVAITAARKGIAQSGVLPKRVLPVSEQPVGAAPSTLETFIAQGRALGNRTQKALAIAQPYGAPLLHSVRNSEANSAATIAELRSSVPATLANLQSTIARAKANIADAQAVLQRRDRSKVTDIAAAFAKSSRDTKQMADALHALRNDPAIQSNLRTSSEQLRAVLADMAQLSRDLQIIAGNPQTKAELRDASARFHAIIKSL